MFLLWCQELIIAPDVQAGGGFAEENRVLAKCALQQLSLRYSKITPEIIEQAIESLPPGRLEVKDISTLGGAKNALLDGAHNRQAWSALRAHLDSRSTEPRTFVLALTRGKDVNDLTALLRPGDRFCAVEFEPVEGMPWVSATPSTEITSALQKLGFEGRSFGSDVQTAIAACSDEAVVVCGSLYLVGQVYRMLDTQRDQTTLVQHLSKTRAFDPANYEKAVAAYWHSLPARYSSGMKRSFLLPPPNVTGSLHIGHALTLAVQDAYARHYAAQGDDVVWVPGTDHAGIATQSVVSRSLAKRGIDCRSMTREAFTSEIWRWVEQYGDRINAQIETLGASLDWDRQYFTLDQKRSIAVNAAFGRLWQDGLIYRDDRMVNWSIGLQSVISDIETDARTIEVPEKIGGAQFGVIWRIRYKAVDADEFIEVETTRPETIFGDRAIAVHPNDGRNKHWVGRRVQHPLMPGITLKIVADAFVDPNFGTGAVKLTPAHDTDDHLAAQRLGGIPSIAVFGKDGKMLPECGVDDLVSLDRLHARGKVVRMLDASGALVSERPHRTTIKLCSRSGGVVEPMPLPQWYIRMRPLAQKVLADDAIAMLARTKQLWRRWLEDCQDWCISRQLVWGHRVPLWRVKGEGNSWLHAKDAQDAARMAGTIDVEQDPDVLDTWFSSGLLPLSSLGWPDNLESNRYPLTFIESGPDILFFWLARMAMLCTYLSPSHEPPFREILLHPIVRDAQGRKMSKSLGNVIDPLDVIHGVDLATMKETLAAGNLDPKELKRSTAELARQFPAGIRAAGTDALRFALLHSMVQEHFLNLDMRNVQQGRYLCGKLWNAAQFWRHHAADQVALAPDASGAADGVDVRWLNTRLSRLSREVDAAFAQRELWRAAERIRAFAVHDLCDTYLELVKPVLIGRDVTQRRQRLVHLRDVLKTVLAIAHPLIPFVTEACWQLLGGAGSLTRHTSANTRQELTPMASELDEKVMTTALQIVDAIRLDGDGCIVEMSIQDEAIRSALEPLLGGLASMSKAERITIVDTVVESTGKVVAPGVSLRIVPGSQTTKPQQVGTPNDAYIRKRKRLQDKLDKLRLRMANAEYASRVPADVRERDRQQLAELEAVLKSSNI